MCRTCFSHNYIVDSTRTFRQTETVGGASGAPPPPLPPVWESPGEQRDAVRSCLRILTAGRPTDSCVCLSLTLKPHLVLLISVEVYGVSSLRRGSLFMDDFTFWPLETTNTSESAFLLFGSLNIVFIYLFFINIQGRVLFGSCFTLYFALTVKENLFLYIYIYFKPPVKWGGRICSGESGDEMNLWCEVNEMLFLPKYNLDCSCE